MKNTSSMLDSSPTGTRVCVDGQLGCTGGKGPVPETCNGLDDDCDGSVDEGVPGAGGPCGEDVGVCDPGIQACVNGTYVCIGGVGPSQETCDCQDNDCDTGVDEDVGCPGSGVCSPEHCQCVQPCAEGEFPCPGGYLAVDEGQGCYCEPDACLDVVCDDGSAPWAEGAPKAPVRRRSPCWR